MRLQRLIERTTYPDGDDPFTPEQVAEFSKHYMKHGNRPYREMYKQ